MKLFTRDKSFYHSLIILAIPIALQNFIAYAVNFADNLMIGRLGEYAISGVYMGNQIQTLLQFAAAGITGSLVVMGAQYWGKKDTDSICRLTGLSVRIALLLGIIVTLAAWLFPGRILGLFTNDGKVIEEGISYLRIVCWSYMFFCFSQTLIAAMQSVETVRIGMYLSIITLFTNISLNYILIFGKLGLPALGIRGAAIATVISRAVEALVMLIYILFIDRKLSFKIRDFFRSGGGLLKDLLRYGAPIFAGQVVWGINNLAQSAIIGHMSAEAISSISIAGNINSLLFMAVLGLGAALGIITGKTVGAGQYETMKQYAVTAQAIFAAIGFLMCFLLLVLRRPYLALYELSPETIKIANQFMIVLAVAMIGRCYQGICLTGLVKAGGQTDFVFKMDTFFVFVILLPSALIAQNIFHAPAWVVYSCLQCDQVLKCFVALVKINRFDWMKNLTRDTKQNT